MDSARRRSTLAGHAFAPERNSTYETSVPEVFTRTYDFLFEMIQMVIGKTGRLRQEVIAFNLRGGIPFLARALWEDEPDLLDKQIDDLLARWPVVAHISQRTVERQKSVWFAPPNNPESQEAVVVRVLSKTADAVAICRLNAVDPGGRRRGVEVQKGILCAAPHRVRCEVAEASEPARSRDRATPRVVFNR
jgi:hypothetical protein